MSSYVQLSLAKMSWNNLCPHAATSKITHPPKSLCPRPDATLTLIKRPLEAGATRPASVSNYTGYTLTSLTWKWMAWSLGRLLSFTNRGNSPLPCDVFVGVYIFHPHSGGWSFPWRDHTTGSSDDRCEEVGAGQGLLRFSGAPAEWPSDVRQTSEGRGVLVQGVDSVGLQHGRCRVCPVARLLTSRAFTCFWDSLPGVHGFGFRGRTRS